MWLVDDACLNAPPSRVPGGRVGWRQEALCMQRRGTVVDENWWNFPSVVGYSPHSSLRNVQHILPRYTS